MAGQSFPGACERPPPAVVDEVAAGIARGGSSGTTRLADVVALAVSGDGFDDGLRFATTASYGIAATSMPGLHHYPAPRGGPAGGVGVLDYLPASSGLV